MNNQHDPYLVTAKRNLNEQRILKRKKRVESKRNQESKESYFSKKINLNQILNLPDGLQQIVFFIFFILIPYVVGLLFILITRLDMVSLQSQKISEFLFFWTIGYELLATILIVFLIQQSFIYRKSS